MKYTFEITGLDDLADSLKAEAKLKLAEEVVRVNTIEMQRKALQNAQMQPAGLFTGFYQGSKFIKPTGATRRSIGSDFSDGGLTGRVGANTEYAAYVNFGTRYMNARPFLTNAYESQKVIFMRDMQRLVA